MKTGLELSGINVFICSDRSRQHIPSESKHYALVLTIDEHQQIVGLDYYDPNQGEISVLNELPFPMQTLEKLKQLAQIRSQSIDNLDAGHMLHLNTSEMESIFPELIQRYIKPELDYAKDYFNSLDHTNFTHKFNRKQSGLAHSYLYDSQYGIVQIANKPECRVLWCEKPPTAMVFDALPDNTSAVYVVVPNQEGHAEKVYYLQKDTLISDVTMVSVDSGDLDVFRRLKLNNRGLTKDELTDLKDNRHVKHTENVYGSGGFARVKRSRSLDPEHSIELATKVLKFKQKGKFEGKVGGRSMQETKAQEEASILADLKAGSEHLVIEGDKGYLQMLALGETLSAKIPSLSFDKKIEYAIKFLLEVDALHQGKAAESSIKRAHRDLKPANVLVDKDDKLHLIDFGLTTTDLHQKSGEMGGTLYYAALDQDVINYYLSLGKKSQKSRKSDSSSALKDGDDDTDQIEEWHSVVSSEDESPETSRLAKYPAHWNSCLANSQWCITQNYLEDDKVAAMRTIYCNPEPKFSDEACSILNKQDFAHLPEPIQALFDSTQVKALFRGHRKLETEGFLAAVLIGYQCNNNLSDAEYEQFIAQLRQTPVLQDRLIEFFQKIDSSPSNFLDSELDQSTILSKEIKLKPMPLERKHSWFQSIHSLWKKSNSTNPARISPTTDVEEHDENDRISPSDSNKLK